jgi:hypothetical protein
LNLPTPLSERRKLDYSHREYLSTGIPAKVNAPDRRLVKQLHQINSTGHAIHRLRHQARPRIKKKELTSRPLRRSHTLK